MGNIRVRISFVLLTCCVGQLFWLSECAGQGTDLDLKWTYRTPWLNPLAIEPDRDEPGLLHIAYKGAGIRLIQENGDGTRPNDVSSIHVAELRQLQAMNLQLVDDTLFVALGDHFRGNSAPGLATIDVSVPANPEVLSVWKTQQRVGKFHRGSSEVLVHNSIAYLAAMSQGIVLFDVAAPDSIRELLTIIPDRNYPVANPNSVQLPNARGCAIKDDLLYVAYDAGGLRVIDISSPKKPTEKWKYLNKQMLHRQQAYNNVTIHGDRAYVAIDYAGLEILDISNPAKIRQVAWWNPWDADEKSNTWLNSPGHTNHIHFDPDRDLVFMSAGDSELLVIDVSEESDPRPIAWYGEPGNRQGAWGVGISADWNTAYVSYINTFVPFHSNWSGVRGIKLDSIRKK